MYCTHICHRHHKLLLHTYLSVQWRKIDLYSWLSQKFVSYISYSFSLELKVTTLMNFLVARKLRYFDKSILYNPIFLRNQLLKLRLHVKSNFQALKWTFSRNPWGPYGGWVRGQYLKTSKNINRDLQNCLSNHIVTIVFTC